MNKKTKTGILLAVVLCLLAGCGKTSLQETDANEEKEAQEAAGGGERTDEETADEEATAPAEPITLVVENPSWEYCCTEKAEPAAQPLVLTILTEEDNGIIGEKEEWLEKNGLSLEMDIQEGYRCELDSPYTGERCNIRVSNDETGEEWILNFTEHQHPENYVPEDEQFINEMIQWVAIREDVLYFSICHMTYAQSAPQNAYVGAYDLKEQKLIWKSQPLVSNARSFVIAGDVILCGYGFTAEPDYLYQLDLTTGQVLDRTPLKTAADYLVLKDDVLYVRTYDTDYTFRVEK